MYNIRLKEEKINRIHYLVDYLNQCNKAYDEGNPFISDEEYDNLYFELVQLERYYNTYLPNSPTQIIDYQVVNSLKKVKHNHPMLSLDKTKDWNEFLRYFDNIDMSKSVVGMLKLDGLTCTLEYENGKLIGAETRGNGEEGEDILHNALVVRNIPNKINKLDRFVIDGEIICTYFDFEQFKNEYANPRNFAAGSIRLLDANECAKRNLSFIAWNIVEGGTNSHMQNLDLADKLGFTSVPWTSSFDWDAKEFLVEKARELGYPIDGLVGKFDDIEFGLSLGSTSHHSRAAMAFKFYDETATTKLLDIEWTMGRTGVLTPVAIFEPVDLEGTIVERASLHNISIMKELLKTPFVGQSIEIFKANQIIPQVYRANEYLGFLNSIKVEILNPDTSLIGVLEYPKAKILDIPSICPICGEPTIEKTDIDSTVLICSNQTCGGRLINRLDHYCGKKGLDIKGLSKATLEKLITWNWVSSFKDLYELKQYREEWIKKEGFGVKSVDNILNAIENSKNCELHQFIAALGIPLIGTTAAKDLARHFGSWTNFIKSIEEKFKFYSLPNFGIETHQKIMKYDYTEAIFIVDNYISFNETQNVKNNEKTLEGLVFVVTGRVNRFKNRDELKEKIESYGGKVTGSISKNTNYLINNDINSNSSKNKAAKSLNIPILSEDSFIETFGIE